MKEVYIVEVNNNTVGAYDKLNAAMGHADDVGSFTLGVPQGTSVTVTLWNTNISNLMYRLEFTLEDQQEVIFVNDLVEVTLLHEKSF